ncbi:cytochrome P450 [Hymenopellis radicata]|nr:cytochrome P450 [Hymenopellis radicata]
MPVADYLITVVLLATTLLIWRQSRSKPKLPPGPPGHFLIGNLLDVPTEQEGKVYAKWGEQYGSDLVSLSMFGQTIIVINSCDKAIEMLDKKNSIYSDRPRFPMTGELMGCKISMGLMPYGPKLRLSRKMMHKELGSNNAIRDFFPHEESMAKQFVSRLLEQPQAFLDHVIMHADSIIMKIAYGYSATSMQDKFIANAVRSMEEMGNGCEPTFLVNSMPALMNYPEYFPWPGTHFKKVAKLWRSHYDAMVNEPFEFAKSQIATGVYEESFVSKWLCKGISPEDEDTLKHATGAMLGGTGGETTAVALSVFFLMMTLHPQVQEAAQKELDAVVGRDRLPTFEDRPRLPYIDAIVKEVLRIHPPVPLSLPHSTTEADVHDGYYIPKASIIFINFWKMTHDPEIHPNPENFDPTRFLGPTPEQDPAELIFGFGRRICPGLRLADATLFITIAMSLSLFAVKPIVKDGKPQVPVFKYVSGPVSRVEPYQCDIIPRDGKEKAATIIAATV